MQTYAFQTGPAKRWPDVCYHFFIGPDGSVWEGRAGSLDGPVVADATGGNQGYAQLICLLGNFMDVAPTLAAQESLIRLMLFLADRYDVDTDPAATVTFTSRGSNKYPAGIEITTSTISGHRDTSATACPATSPTRSCRRGGRRVQRYAVLHRTQHRCVRDGHPPRRPPRLTAPRLTAPRRGSREPGMEHPRPARELDSTKYRTRGVASAGGAGWEGRAVACAP